MAKRIRKVNQMMLELLKEKATHSPCTYKISAIAFDSHGDVLGHMTNNHSKNWNVLEKDGVGRSGTAEHAERNLIRRYKNHIKTIVICRIGRSGDLKPISPCKACQKAADKYGIKIMSVCN